jgi:hypothetical protein
MNDVFVDATGRPIRSLAVLNNLPDAERFTAYRTLLPDEILTRFGLDPARMSCDELKEHIVVETTPGSGSAVIKFYHRPNAADSTLYMQLTDTTNNQIVVLLLVINDPDSPRFDVDLNWDGGRTKFGTQSRNLEAELAAMQAGLAPGQVRRGLRMSRTLLGNFEDFIGRLYHEMFFLEPLAYHTAVLFERYGCAYSQGQRLMNDIHQQFQPGGALFARLDGSTPFRAPGAEKTVRGRSWAIHDGILGEPFTEVHMYKHIGKHAGVCTFSDAVW